MTKTSTQSSLVLNPPLDSTSAKTFIIYRDRLNGLYVVASNLFLALPGSCLAKFAYFLANLCICAGNLRPGLRFAQGFRGLSEYRNINHVTSLVRFAVPPRQLVIRVAAAAAATIKSRGRPTRPQPRFLSRVAELPHGERILALWTCNKIGMEKVLLGLQVSLMGQLS